MLQFLTDVETRVYVHSPNGVDGRLYAQADPYVDPLQWWGDGGTSTGAVTASAAGHVAPKHHDGSHRLMPASSDGLQGVPRFAARDIDVWSAAV